MRHELHHGRVVRCLADRPRNLAECLAAALARDPEGEAVVEGERRMTYAGLDRAARALAARMIALGVTPGDRVAVLLGNRIEYPVIVLACTFAGAIAVPMNIRQTAAETAHALAASGARLLFHEADARLPDRAEVPALAALVAIADDAPLAETLAPQDVPVSALPPLPGEDEPAVILFTSGTTGKPKGAVLTHCNIAHSILHFRHHYALREGERCLLAVPASHVTGLVALLATSLGLGGCLVIMREFKAGEFLRLMAQEQVGYTLVVPAMLTLALMQPQFDSAALSNWRVCGFGGAPMPDATIADLALRLPGLALHNTYGATETTSPAVIMPADQAAARSRQLGLPVLCCDLLVMDDQGRECPPGEQGEIWMAGPMVIPRYWNDTAATAAAFVHGYWKSGDIGSRDADGHVSIHDRMKDMINRGGFKIYSVEVENALCAHPAVIEAAVVGRPCPVLGERVVAFVHAGAPASAEELRAHVAARLSDYKVPEDIRFETVPLPRNANGKLLKHALRDRLVGA